jgi:hypothetical protein
LFTPLFTSASVPFTSRLFTPLFTSASVPFTSAP